MLSYYFRLVSIVFTSPNEDVFFRFAFFDGFPMFSYYFRFAGCSCAQVLPMMRVPGKPGTPRSVYPKTLGTQPYELIGFGDIHGPQTL